MHFTQGYKVVFKHLFFFSFFFSPNINKQIIGILLMISYKAMLLQMH